ncbi:cation diffusion facilitator family transporter [Paenibacillus sp. J2TS4]|uniref:cation diffusion facilitator family transporter n=1 Tax=Paenibacillus sp. J2TS4 TaxID=2807194 RepID=UPI001B113B62|nr:cation diffusion facilitator family transporter [Paenibacillus sp. J2TS4]GIP31403.1 cation transporter [Paenibacillus sp. J2TS4]
MSYHSYGKAGLAALLRLAGNLLLALIKGIVGWLASSPALIADAVHTASNGIGDLIVLLRLRELNPPSHKRARGQGNLNMLLIIGAAAVLLVSGIELGLEAVHIIQKGEYGPPQGYVVLLLLLSLAVKALADRGGQAGEKRALLTKRSYRRERKYSYASSFIALIGTAVAWCGAWLDITLLFILDPLAAIGIGLLIIRAGYRLLLESRTMSFQRALGEEDLEELIRVAQRVKGVIAVDDLKAYEQGHFVLVDLQVSVNPQITVMEGNEIAKRIKHHLMKRFMHIADVIVAVQPYDGGYPYRNSADADLENRSLFH